jgi:hypothetical protein
MERQLTLDAKGSTTETGLAIKQVVIILAHDWDYWHSGYSQLGIQRNSHCTAR